MKFIYFCCCIFKILIPSSRMSKIIIVGDVSVGKTSLVQRFVTNSFNHDYKATIGVDFEIEKFQILKTNFNLQIWDTAGQERFKCIAKAYYRGFIFFCFKIFCFNNLNENRCSSGNNHF
jgi:small GTP-binding protein